MRKGNASHHREAGRLTALLLALLLTAGLAPVSARAVSSAHFTDVVPTHWAYPYVERAYLDGAIVGVGGDPAAGTGVFAPNTDVTYGQFLTMLVSAFYPEDLAVAVKEGPWYAPSIQVAAERELSYLTRQELTQRAERTISRYDMAWILVELLEDQGAQLPTQQERDQAAKKIGDWTAVEAAEDGHWTDCVSSIYALGIISGVDAGGTFAGDASTTRASAAVIYTKMANALSADPQPEFRMTFGDGWELIGAPGYRQEMAEVFYEVYPRLWARWGRGTIQKTVSVSVEPLLPNGSTDNGSIMVTSTTKRGNSPAVSNIRVSAKLQYRYPAAYSTAHELVHVMHSDYPFSPAYTSSWWDECMADYGQFRYYRWADGDQLTSEDIYRASDPALRAWSYEAYGDSQWFFAYMDAKYPTTPQGPGLIDSIHDAIAAGQVTSDSPYDPTFNAVVKRVTGYDTIEQLRQRYVQELDAGTWTFNGFGGYADNYITEHIPGVPDPTYPTTPGSGYIPGTPYSNTSGSGLGPVPFPSWSYDMDQAALTGDRRSLWQLSA